MFARMKLHTRLQKDARVGLCTCISACSIPHACSVTLTRTHTPAHIPRAFINTHAQVYTRPRTRTSSWLHANARTHAHRRRAHARVGTGDFIQMVGSRTTRPILNRLSACFAAAGVTRLIHPHRDWAHPSHICTRFGLTPATICTADNAASTFEMTAGMHHATHA